MKIASNSFHARRARRYVLTQAPELAGRLQRAQDYRFGEWSAVKVLLVAHEWRRVAVAHRREERAARSVRRDR